MQILCKYANIMQKLCKYYAEIMQKLRKNYANYADYVEIMQKLCKKNYAKLCKNYAKIMQKLCKIMQCSRNALLCMHYAKIMRMMQKLCKLCKSPKIMQITHPPTLLMQLQLHQQSGGCQGGRRGTAIGRSLA